MKKRSIMSFSSSVFSFALILFIVMNFAEVSFAKTPDEIRGAIEAILTHRHPKDDAKWWRELGPEAPAVIISMYRSSEEIYERLRLLQGLAWFEDSRAIEFIKEQAQKSQESSIRNAALRTLGISQGAKEIEFVAKYLDHSDPQTRIAAAETLQAMNHSQSQKVLEAYYPREPLPWVVSRSKGLLPSEASGFKIVSHFKERLDPQWAGSWMGYWILPLPPTEKAEVAEAGMQSWKAQLTLQLNSEQLGRGELRLEREGRTGAPPVQKISKKGEVRLQGKGVRAYLQWTEKTLAPSKESWGGEAELTVLHSLQGVVLLGLRVQEIGGILWLRKVKQ